tara:strand:+ start:62 stop:313 length:252 start_codon:yes stop_codon:yes gene_type:complete
MTQEGLVDAYQQGHHYMVRVEGATDAAFDFADLIVAKGSTTHDYAMHWLEKSNATSVATYQILPDGKKNLMRFYDYRDLQGAA